MAVAVAIMAAPRPCGARPGSVRNRFAHRRKSAPMGALYFSASRATISAKERLAVGFGSGSRRRSASSAKARSGASRTQVLADLVPVQSGPRVDSAGPRARPAGWRPVIHTAPSFMMRPSSGAARRPGGSAPGFHIGRAQRVELRPEQIGLEGRAPRPQAFCFSSVSAWSST